MWTEIDGRLVESLTTAARAEGEKKSSCVQVTAVQMGLIWTAAHFLLGIILKVTHTTVCR